MPDPRGILDLGPVIGQPGIQGPRGPGYMMVQNNITSASGLVIGLVLINTGIQPITVANQTVAVGQATIITSLTPFAASVPYQWTGAPGPRGSNFIPTVVSLPAPPAGAMVGDLILNTSITNLLVGNLSTVAPGDIVRISTLSPFVVTAEGNIKGDRGEPGVDGKTYPVNVATRGMIVGRAANTHLWGAAASIISVGSKVIIGTYDVSTTILVYDANTNNISELGPFPSGSWGLQDAFAVVGTKVIIGSGNANTTLIVYDINTNSAREVGPLSFSTAWGRGGAHAVIGSKAVFGTSNNNISMLVVYDADTDTVSEVGPLSSSTWGSFGAVAVVGNKVVFGASTPGKIAVYDSITNTASELEGVPTGVSWGDWGALAVVGSKVVVGSSSNAVTNLVVYNSITNTVSVVGTLSARAWGGAAAVATIGNKVIFGSSTTTTTLAVYDADDNTVSELGTLPALSWGFGGFLRSKNCAVVGNCVVFGSAAVANTTLAVYDASTNTVKVPIGTIPASYWYATQSAVVGSRLIICSAPEYVSTPRTFIPYYDADTNILSTIDNLSSHLWGEQSAVAVVGNKVVIGSGDNSRTVVVYDLVSRTAREVDLGLTHTWGSDESVVVVGDKVVLGAGTTATIPYLAVVYGDPIP